MYAQKVIKLTQLLETSNGANQLMAGLDAAHPVAGDLDMLTVSLNSHSDPVQHHSGDCLPISGGCCRSLPEYRNIFGETPNGLLFCRL